MRELSSLSWTPMKADCTTKQYYDLLFGIEIRNERQAGWEFCNVLLSVDS